MLDTLVIVNPQSQNGAAGRSWQRLEPLFRARFEAAGLGPVEVAQTRGMRDAERLAREGVHGGAKRIVVAGGDGTLGEVATGLLEADLGTRAALGVIPLGRGCDFARTLGTPLEPEEAIAQLATLGSSAGGGECEIDAGQVTTTAIDGDAAGKTSTRFFVNETSLGVSGLVVKMVNRAGPLARRLGGTAVFAQATLRSLAAYRPECVRIRVDGREVYAGPVIQAAIANGRYFGGGMRFAPDAEPDDGLFDLVWIRGWSKASLAARLPLLYSGTHLQHPSVSSARGSRFELESAPEVAPDGHAASGGAASFGSKICFGADGESLGGLPATVELLPKALRLFGVAKPR